MSIEIEHANALIKTAFDRQHDKIDMSGGVNDGIRLNINLETIIDILMTNVGRFCEAHLNDFLITWESVKTAMNDTKPGCDYIAFGIRQFGVDSNMFIYSRVKDHKHQAGWASTYYRKIFAVKIQRELETAIFGQTPDDQMVVSIILKNITDEIRYTDIEPVGTAHHNDLYPSRQNQSTLVKNMTAFHPDEKPATTINPSATTTRGTTVGDWKRTYLTLHHICPSVYTVAHLHYQLTALKDAENQWVAAGGKDYADYLVNVNGLVAAIDELEAQYNMK